MLFYHHKQNGKGYVHVRSEYKFLVHDVVEPYKGLLQWVVLAANSVNETGEMHHAATILLLYLMLQLKLLEIEGKREHWTPCIVIGWLRWKPSACSNLGDTACVSTHCVMWKPIWLLPVLVIQIVSFDFVRELFRRNSAQQVIRMFQISLLIMGRNESNYSFNYNTNV